MSKLLRDTKQRNAIKRAFFEHRRPLGPKEVLQFASEEVPNIGIATVYRNIKALQEEKELIAVEIPGQPPRYCIPGDRTSCLFVCEKTDRVFFVDCNAQEFDCDSLPPEFEVSHYEVILYGEFSA